MCICFQIKRRMFVSGNFMKIFSLLQRSLNTYLWTLSLLFPNGIWLIGIKLGIWVGFSAWKTNFQSWSSLCLCAMGKRLKLYRLSRKEKQGMPDALTSLGNPFPSALGPSSVHSGNSRETFTNLTPLKRIFIVVDSCVVVLGLLV